MNKPLRVLCVFSRLDRGGAESMCMNLYRAIDKEKVQFDFVKHTRDKGQFEEEILSLGGRVYEAPAYRLYNHVEYCMWWRKHFREHPEHQIIHGHFFTISAVYFKIAKEYKRITVGHCHCTKTPRSQYKNKLKAVVVPVMLKQVAVYSDYCFACSKDAGMWLFPNKEFRVLNNAIDTTQFCYNEIIAHEVKKEFDLEDTLVIGAVGRFNQQKNPYGIMDIFKKVYKDRPDSRLLWVGDGSLRSEIETKIHEYDLEQAVILTGIRNDTPRLFQAMDVYIMPSLYEGLPVAGIEAQAAGLPCLFSDTVSRDVAITDCCEFLPLDQLNIWRDRILVNFQVPRKNTYQAIVDAGYDIHTTAEWLQGFYTDIVAEKRQRI